MEVLAEEEFITMTRQPIFDGHQKVIAYELLARNTASVEAAVFGEHSNAGEEILQAYTSLSQGGESRRVTAFLPVNTSLIRQTALPELPRKQVVFVIEVDDEIDAALIKGVDALAESGYRLVLKVDRYHNQLDPLLERVQIVKLDVSQLDEAAIKQQMQQMTPFKVAFLADKIESYELLEACIDMHFRLFQGSFLSKPKSVKARQINPSQVVMLQLLQALNDPDVTPEVLEELIRRDPVLTFKMLRIVNSAAFSLMRKVESVAEAVVMLGLEQVKRWASLIAMSSNSDKPEELTRTLLIRGRMSELLAERLGGLQASSCFMAGMLSGLHAILDIDQETMLEQVPLNEDIKAAVLSGDGPMGELLSNVINYETGEWGKLPLEFDANAYDTAYRASLRWADESLMMLDAE